MPDDEVTALVLDDSTEKMDKAVTHARAEFATVRTGRASSGLVEKLVVDYHGVEVPLQQLANFSVPEARLLVIAPYDKGSIGAIEKAIQESDLGLNPSNDGQVIRLSFPALTADRRKELVRMVRQMAEDSRVTVRNLRRSARQELEAFEKDGELSSDDLHRAEEALDKATHDSEGHIDEALEAKERELLDD